MPAVASPIDNLIMNIVEEIHVRSSLEATFAAILEELGPSNVGQNNAPMPMVLEAWPGGRWFRDLGDNNGHFWGQVQAIKRPTLLEITGPLMISSASTSNLQYRLKQVEGGTLITFHHTALGLLPDGHREGFAEGWKGISDRIRRRAEQA